jgi:hypothetical protein
LWWLDASLGLFWVFQLRSIAVFVATVRGYVKTPAAGVELPAPIIKPRWSFWKRTEGSWPVKTRGFGRPLWLASLKKLGLGMWVN